MDSNKNSFWMKGIWKDHVARYAFAASIIKKGNVLDIACGEGYGSAYLSEFSTHIRGVDVSVSAIKNAKSRYGNKYKNLAYTASDALLFLSNNKESFETIISFETIEHIKKYEEFLFLIKKNLKKSGTFILSTPNKLFSNLFAGGTFNPYHVNEFYTNELVDLVTKVFGNKVSIYLQRPVKKKRLVIGALMNMIFHTESSIRKYSEDFEGLGILLVVRT